MSRRVDKKKWNSHDRYDSDRGRYGHGHSSNYNHDNRKYHDNKGINKKRTVKFKSQHKLESLMRKKDKRLDDDEMMYMVNDDNARTQRGENQRNFKYVRFGNNVPFQCGEEFPFSLILVLFGKKFEKSEIINSFSNAVSPLIFSPLYWKEDSRRVGFFIDDLAVAKKLHNIPKVLKLPNGRDLSFTMRKAVPIPRINDELKELIKLTMSKRYNADKKALDLSKFYKDENFKETFVGLMYTSIMSIVIDIIAENIPDLEALNLNDNFIWDFMNLKEMALKFKNLKILYLDGNRLNTISPLYCFKGLQIEEFALKRNPFIKRYRDESEYVSELQKKFPKLKILDGQNLKPLIGFEVMDPDVMPSVKQSFLIGAPGSEVVQQFIQQYFTIYDSDNRQPLIDAYHENAMLSLSAATNQPRLSHYSPYVRNLKSHDAKLKNKNVRCGKLPILSLLTELPKTQHDPLSFTVDMTFYSPKMILFIVTGIFKEFSSDYVKSPGELRSFERTFVVIPWGNGFCIANELFLISNVTPVQLKSAFKQSSIEVNPQPSTSKSVSTDSFIKLPNSSNLKDDNQTDENLKLQMIQLMCQHSKMNMEWSKKCLEETNWDYNHAIHAFNELQKQNKIPKEAFI